ncbi:YdeI/OmpD-associated family protein [Cytophaga aurantiaca]|uniref:YdeI/OmpD-associated family protein n=1 Tax=Cytophaga aurantiaca TaxID=29530 RepID=UPI00036D37D3|nr:YdeI/OmpD-associated family protein [Cytophaga aurantiaca]
MSAEEIKTFYPKSRKAWRQWLSKYHRSEQSVWLLLYKKESGKPSISWSDAVEEALCFGWIDSKRKSLDAESFIQFFCQRKPKGTWSKVNKEKVLQLIEDGLMTERGLESIEKAKQNGSWVILDEVEELTIPIDLGKAFKAHKGSKDYFLSLSKSVRKMILYWVVSAKREETRQKRITEIVERAAQGLKPKHL